MPNVRTEGVINESEAYSKHTVLRLLGVSQKVWDQLLDEGLPYTTLGHTRWVSGKDLIKHLASKAERKVR